MNMPEVWALHVLHERIWHDVLIRGEVFAPVSCHDLGDNLHGIYTSSNRQFSWNPICPLLGHLLGFHIRYESLLNSSL